MDTPKASHWPWHEVDFTNFVHGENGPSTIRQTQHAEIGYPFKTDPKPFQKHSLWGFQYQKAGDTCLIAHLGVPHGTRAVIAVHAPLGPLGLRLQLHQLIILRAGLTLTVLAARLDARPALPHHGARYTLAV